VRCSMKPGKKAWSPAIFDRRAVPRVDLRFRIELASFANLFDMRNAAL
jgi:hypothetical protein